MNSLERFEAAINLEEPDRVVKPIVKTISFHVFFLFFEVLIFLVSFSFFLDP